MLKQKQNLPPQADQPTTFKRKTGKQIIKLGVFLTLSVFAFLSYTYFTQAQIPDFVNYQGRLRDSAGAPITAATTIQFSLYNHLTNGGPGDVPGAAGELLWTETYDGAGGCTQITPGDDGIFAQHLGDCISFPDYLDFTEEYYLGVKIGADAEASPRVPLSTHPYAFTSKRLNVRDENIYITSENSGDIILQAADDILLHDTNDEIGTNGQLLSSTGTGIDWIDASSLSAGSLWDADHDTGIQVEEGVDDDTIRFDTLNTQRMAIDNAGNIIFSDIEPASFINPGAMQGLLFRDDKFALRVGEVQNTEWDDANVGRGTFASGRNNIVSGNYSTALGGNNNINDVYATALGRNHTVTGSYSVAGGFQNTAGGYASTVFGQTNQATDRRAMAWGLDNTASQDEATAWGRNTNASANYATSWGRDTVASGELSTAFGYQNTASQQYGTAFGYRNTASGRYSTVWGGQNTASGQYSTAWGSHNTASGAHSTAIGFYSTASAENGTAIGDALANSNYMTAIGRFNENVAGEDLTNWVDTDQLFVIGNGSGWQDANRSNALTILKNGNMTINALQDGAALTNQPTGAVDLAIATTKYVDDTISGVSSYALMTDLHIDNYKMEGKYIFDCTLGLDDYDYTFNAGTHHGDEIYPPADTCYSYLDVSRYKESDTGDTVVRQEVTLSGGNTPVRIFYRVYSNSHAYWSDWTSTSDNLYLANGTLADDRTLAGANHSLNFTGMQDFNINTPYFWVDTGLGGELEIDGAVITWLSQAGELGMDSNDVKFTDIRAVGDKRGIEYTADYSADFTNRTLVDKEYVDNNVGVFENNLGVVRNKGIHASDDFVFGSSQLDDDGDTTHDSRMFFDKSKSAFRAGNVVGNEWNEANLGNYSAGFGYRNIVNGDYAFSSGHINNNSGHSSVAMGYGLIVSGDYSVAMGLNNQATNHSSSVFGTASTATGISSFAAGNNVDATGDYSNASGYQTTASGLYSSAMGWGIEAGSSGVLAIALNDQTGTNCNQANSMCVMGGDIGFGIETPTSILHIDSNNTNDAAIFTMENTAGDMQIFRADANPESGIVGSIGDWAFDSTNGEAYIKNTGDATNTGWLRMLRMGDLASLWDTNGDTGIQVEESANEDMIRFDTAGNERLIIDNNGNIGIKTTNPTVDLEIQSDSDDESNTFVINDSAGNNNFSIRDSGAIEFGDGQHINNRTLFRARGNGLQQDVKIVQGLTTDIVRLQIGDTFELVRNGGAPSLINSPALGIEVRSPYLRLNSSVDGGSILSMDNSSGGVAEIQTGQTSGESLLRFSNSHNLVNTVQFKDSVVAISDATEFIPIERLEIEGALRIASATGSEAGTIQWDGTNFQGHDGTNWTNLDTTTFTGLTDTPAGYTAGSILFTSGTAVTQDNNNFFWDDTNNRLGIGTSTPSAQLHTTGPVRFQNFGAGTMQTDANGNISVSSDERLKNVQGVFNRGLEELLNINPIEYKWKKETGYDTENSYYGFSAQNVKLSIPEAVGKDGRGYLTLSDRPLLATAINAIKELNQKQEEQKVTITSNTLKTDSSIETLTELQASVDSNLTIINTSLTNLGKETKKNTAEIKDNKKDLAELSENISALTELTTNLVDTINNHETRIAELEALIGQDTSIDNQGINATELPEVLQTFAANLEVLEEDSEVKFTLEGELVVEKITAEELEVEKITADKIIVKKDTVGTAKIKEGETSVTVETSAVDENSHIILTPHGATPVGLADIEDGEGFTIEINEELNKDLKVEWFIVQGIE